MKNADSSLYQKLDYYEMNEKTDILCQKYSFVSVTSLGQTVLGKRIPIISVGHGNKEVLYVGAQRGTERLTASCLLRYVEELCAAIENDARIFNCSAKYLSESRTVSVIPMLNPDGAEYCEKGMTQENPLYERFNSNGMQLDFSNWSGNALGIELKTNYGERFDDMASKECTAESGALRNYLMFNENIKLVLTLGKGACAVTHSSRADTYLKIDSLGRAIARFCDASYFKSEDIGTLSGFCAVEREIPCYELNSEYRNESDIFNDYLRLRKALFLSPTLI